MNPKAGGPRTILVSSVTVLALVSLASPGFARASQQKSAAPTPIAVQEHEVAGVDVALMEVKRNTDNTVTVKWQYRNTTNEKKALRHGFSVGMDSYRFARKETYLVDTAKETKYEVLEDTEGNPAAAKQSQFQFSITLAPKQTVNTWAKFAGIPPDLKTVTVYLPGPPPFEDVPISGK